jgi:signal transduction histidine kinase
MDAPSHVHKPRRRDSRRSGCLGAHGRILPRLGPTARRAADRPAIIRRRRLPPAPIAADGAAPPTREPASRLDAGTATKLDATIEETDRLSTLVNDLLQLARADEHPATVHVDLARLTADRIDTWTAVAATRNVLLDAIGSDRDPQVVTRTVVPIRDECLSLNDDRGV